MNIVYAFIIFLCTFRVTQEIDENITFVESSQNFTDGHHSTQDNSTFNETQEEKIYLNQNISSINEATGENQSTKILSFSEWKGTLSDEAEDDDNETSESERTHPLKNGDSNLSFNQHAHQNYALKDCGARVISSNPESTHASDILIQDLDAYALSPCYNIDPNGEQSRTKIFFIIQLCEKISIRSFALANVEIYSSNPKTVSLYYSLTHDSHDINQEWHHVGTFIANDSKTLQTFFLETNTHFTKIIKVEILDYYDNDPYCPLTTLQVFGLSLIDKLTFNPVQANRKPLPNKQEIISANESGHKFSGSTFSSKTLLLAAFDYFIVNCLKLKTFRKLTPESIPLKANSQIVNDESQSQAESFVPLIVHTNYTDSGGSFRFMSQEMCSLRQFRALQSICNNLTTTCLSFDVGIFENFQNGICSQIVKDAKHTENLTQELSKQNENEQAFGYSSEIDHHIPTDTLHSLKLKIRDLRKNLTLTTKYLEEVSVRFRQAIQELRESNEKQMNVIERNQHELVSTVSELITLIYEQNKKIDMITTQILVYFDKVNQSAFTLTILKWFLLFHTFLSHIYICYVSLGIIARWSVRFGKYSAEILDRWFYGNSPEDSSKLNKNDIILNPTSSSKVNSHQKAN